MSSQSSLVFVVLSARLDCWDRHRFTLVFAETQDVRNVLDVSLAWCNVNDPHSFSLHGGNCTVILDPSAQRASA